LSSHVASGYRLNLIAIADAEGPIPIRSVRGGVLVIKKVISVVLSGCLQFANHHLADLAQWIVWRLSWGFGHRL
jgi:hypothetical protein